MSKQQKTKTVAKKTWQNANSPGYNSLILTVKRHSQNEWIKFTKSTTEDGLLTRCAWDTTWNMTSQQSQKTQRKIWLYEFFPHFLAKYQFFAISCTSDTYSVTETRETESCKVVEVLNEFVVGPASNVLQRLWQVPVIQSNKWLDARRQQAVNQTIVVVDAFLVNWRRCPIRQQARPRDWKPIVRQLQYIRQSMNAST